MSAHRATALSSAHAPVLGRAVRAVLDSGAPIRWSALEAELADRLTPSEAQDILAALDARPALIADAIAGA